MPTITTIDCRFSNLDGFLEQFNSPNPREATQLWKVIPDGAVELRLTTDCPCKGPTLLRVHLVRKINIGTAGKEILSNHPMPDPSFGNQLVEAAKALLFADL